MCPSYETNKWRIFTYRQTSIPSMCPYRGLLYKSSISCLLSYYRYSSDFSVFTQAIAHHDPLSLLLADASSPPIISHLARDRSTKTSRARSPAGHLLNSSAYVSLIRVCKSIAMGKDRAEWGRTREQAGREDCVWSGRRCPCFHELRTAPRSKEYLPYPLRAALVTVKGFHRVARSEWTRLKFCESLWETIFLKILWSCSIICATWHSKLFFVHIQI